MKRLIFTLMCLLPLHGAMAMQTARPGKTDPRIRFVVYNERDVVQVQGHYGFSTQITFGRDEEIMHVSAGDSLAWQIVPKLNHVFIKPVEDNASTNLLVLTNKHSYHFDLRAQNARRSSASAKAYDESLSFAIKFHYPEDEMAAALARTTKNATLRAAQVVPDRSVSPAQMNFDYTMRGNEQIAPTRVFDDGEFTYFQFPKEIDTPAIFLVSADQQESLVNFHVRGKYLVVQRIGGQYVLRTGALATCIYNEGYLARLQPSELPRVDAAPAS